VALKLDPDRRNLQDALAERIKEMVLVSFRLWHDIDNPDPKRSDI
jgi:hypothetical protein